MAKKLNTIQQRNYNNLLTAVESNDRTTAKEVFDRFFKGKEIEEVVIDKLKEKHDITYLTEASVEPKKAAVSPKSKHCYSEKKTKFLLNLNQKNSGRKSAFKSKYDTIINVSF
ncbi:MAG: hypothetical protein ACLT69_13260 [Intestinibacter bartlettii]